MGFSSGALSKTFSEGGSYVLADSFSLAEYLSLWGFSTGLAKDKSSTEVVPIPLDSYRSIWSGYGDRMGEMMACWGYAREKSWYTWYTPLGTPPVDGLSVLGEAEKNSLISTLEPSC